MINFKLSSTRLAYKMVSCKKSVEGYYRIFDDNRASLEDNELRAICLVINRLSQMARRLSLAVNKTHASKSAFGAVL